MTDILTIRRGDDERRTLDCIRDKHGTEYTLKPGDYMVLTVKSSPDESSPVLLESRTETMTFVFPHEKTALIPAGKYSADVSLFIAQPDGSHLRQSIFPDDEYIAEFGKTGGEKNWKNFIVNAEVGNE